jgi:hypothetical protein
LDFYFIQVMTPQVIRMEFVQDPSEAFNDYATFVIVNRKVPCVEYEKSITGSGVSIQTKYLHLEYSGSESDF